MNNNLVYRGMKYFWFLFVINLAFLIGNSWLVFTLLNVRFVSVGILFYLVGGVLLFPNLLALFATVRGMIIKKQEQHLFTSYFRHLKENFRLGIKIAVPYLGLLVICTVNLMFLGSNGLNGFSPFFLVVMILLALHLLIFLTLQSELILSGKDTAKLGFYLIAKHGIRSLAGVLLVFTIMISLQVLPQYFVLFGFSGAAALMVLLYKSPIKEAVAKVSGRDRERERELMRQLF